MTTKTKKTKLPTIYTYVGCALCLKERCPAVFWVLDGMDSRGGTHFPIPCVSVDEQGAALELRGYPALRMPLDAALLLLVEKGRP